MINKGVWKALINPKSPFFDHPRKVEFLLVAEDCEHCELNFEGEFDIKYTRCPEHLATPRPRDQIHPWEGDKISCLGCAEDFLPKHTRHLYCSDGCREKHYALSGNFGMGKRNRPSLESRDLHQCFYCNSRQGPFQADHVFPKAFGGLTNFENLVWCCEACNKRKGCDCLPLEMEPIVVEELKRRNKTFKFSGTCRRDFIPKHLRHLAPEDGPEESSHFKALQAERRELDRKRLEVLRTEPKKTPRNIKHHALFSKPVRAPQLSAAQKEKFKAFYQVGAVVPLKKKTSDVSLLATPEPYRVDWGPLKPKF